jgi:hypothetical protein
MKFLSLAWFKSKIENTVEKVVTNKIENLIDQINQEEEVSQEKPFLHIKLVNDSLTVVLSDGEILTKPKATELDFERVKNASSKKEILKIVSSAEGLLEKIEKEKEITKMKAIVKGIDVLNTLEDFNVKEGSVYMSNINRSMPQLLIERFLEIVDKHTNCPSEDLENALKEDVNYTSLKKFWLKCCLNPNARSAEDLYEFLFNHQFKIDKHGNFYTYRRVVSKENANKELVDFVSNSYNKIKAIWKKNPDNYNVYYKLGDFKILKLDQFPAIENLYWKLVGNLKDLYLNLPNYQSNNYTSAHTGQEDYRVGSVISMPRNEGDDDNTRNCSYGFHQASKMYDYAGFGDTPILSIVNPMDVLAVPIGEVGKLRVCRWFFACTLDETEKYILDDEDFDVTDLGDVFEELCNENLIEYVHNSFVEEVQRHTFTIPSISTSEIINITSSLEEMRQILVSRVKNIK